MNDDVANSPDELMDIVNDHDEVIGQASRKDVHDKGLLHRGIEIWVYDVQNRLLIQQRSAKKKKHPLAWTRSVGGHVPAGMSADEAAAKELQEELGFSAPLMFVRKELSLSSQSNRFRYVYLCKYSGEKIQINIDEVEQVKFVTKADVEEILAEGADIPKTSLKNMMAFWHGKLV